MRLNGDKLVLRATLPPKLGERGNKQRDISLGIPASKDGLRRAEAEAQKLGSLLAMGQFDWQSYGKLHEDADAKTVSQLVEEFKVEYLRSHKLKETTWRETWQRTYDRLPQDDPLTEGAVLAVVLGTEPHTRPVN